MCFGPLVNGLGSVIDAAICFTCMHAVPSAFLSPGGVAEHGSTGISLVTGAVDNVHIRSLPSLEIFLFFWVPLPNLLVLYFGVIYSQAL